jgi:hypothetical protein
MERDSLIEQTDFQDIDVLMDTMEATRVFLNAHTNDFELKILVGPYGMMTLKTIIYGSVGQNSFPHNC